MNDQTPRELKPGGAPERVATALARYVGIPVEREKVAEQAGVQTCKLTGILTSIESHFLVAEDDEGRLIYMGRKRAETKLEREVREERERREKEMEHE